MAADKRKCRDCGLARRELQGEENSRRRVCFRCQRAKARKTSRVGHIARTYGLTQEDHDRLLAHQDGRCAICQGVRTYNLAVDHDHHVDSGYVRGLLCKRCNKVLRDVRDTIAVLQGAIEYLRWPPAAQLGIQAKAETTNADH